MSRDHRKLRAFQLADELVIEVYGATRRFPREELFGMTSQMRRAAISVAANIVEGSARTSQRDYTHFLQMAHASLRELGYYIDLAQRLEYLDNTAGRRLQARYENCARVLATLIRRLSPQASSPTPQAVRHSP